MAKKVSHHVHTGHGKFRKPTRHEVLVVNTIQEHKHLSTHETQCRLTAVEAEIINAETEKRRYQALILDLNVRLASLKSMHEGLSAVISSRG